MPEKPESKQNQAEEPRIGVYVCNCGGNIGDVVRCRQVAEALGKLPDVAVSREHMFMCSDPAQLMIKEDVEKHGVNRVVVGACSPFLHEQTFRRAVSRAGLNPYLYTHVGLREQDSWVHHNCDIVAAGLWIYLARRNKAEDYGDDEPATLSERIIKRGWGWLASGLVIGVISIAAYPLSAAAGRNYPLGITGGWVAIFKSLVTGENAMSWEAFLVLGVVIGAAIAALIAGEIGLRAPAPKMLVQTFGGGLLMGFGAFCASGCNVGHILSGVPQLSIGSIVGGISIVLGAWFMAYMMFIRPQRVKSRQEQERAAHAHA